MSFVALAIGAGVGIAKNELVDQPAAKRQRTLAAATQRYSPWTHLQAGPVADPNVLGAAIGGAGSGAAVGQGITAANDASALNAAKIQALQNGNNANTGGGSSNINIGGSSNALGNYNFGTSYP
jgi:hypothetical protein